MKKSYLLNVSQFCPESCHFCPSLGYCHESKDLEEIKQSLAKAAHGDNKVVYLPCNSILQPQIQLEEIFEISKSYGLEVVIQINSRTFNKNWFKRLEEFTLLGCKLQLVMGDSRLENDILAKDTLDKNLINKNISDKEILSEKILSQLDFINQYFSSILFIINKNLPADTVEILAMNFKIPMFYKFPMDECGQGIFKKNYEVQTQLLKLDEIKGIKNFADFEVYDPSVEGSYDHEPNISPIHRYPGRGSEELEYSVVIPTYNNEEYIEPVLHHLFDQELRSPKFEVIIVNDGSTDKTLQVVENFIQNNLGKNIILIDFQRPSARRMGDNQFRAGISRNLGAREAIGTYLVFLDADILVPHDFFVNLNKEVKEDRVIQFNRHFLKKEVSYRETRFDKMDLKKDTFVPEGGYWKKFFDSKTPWMNMEFPWKYVCTYGLVVNHKLFNELGGFRRNYTSYGFEDTDLGYRLYKIGSELFKSNIQTLHLNHSHFRSEYMNNFLKRFKLLKRTARIFYFNNLDRDTFKALGNLVDDRNLMLKTRDWILNFARKYNLLSK